MLSRLRLRAGASNTWSRMRLDPQGQHMAPSARSDLRHAVHTNSIPPGASPFPSSLVSLPYLAGGVPGSFRVYDDPFGIVHGLSRLANDADTGVATDIDIRVVERA